MIQRQLKLRLTVAQEKELERWLYHLTGLWNWAIRKIELDANDGIYYSDYDFMALVNRHGKKIGILQESVKLTAKTARDSWQRCFNKISRRPKFKGIRNKLNSIPFVRSRIKGNSRIRINVIGELKFFKQDIPAGEIKGGRIIKRASGWYISLVIDAEPNKILIVSNNVVGIDSGFNSLLTLSNGEKIESPKEYERIENRLAQAQRNKGKLVGRIQERIANQRKDRNHKLSRKLVSENRLIAFSADRHSKIAKRFGKSVASSGHYQLRSMLAYKCRSGGRQYIEVNSKNSTRTCSSCGALTGPTGLAGLQVRQWVCSCGAEHDRDVNAAMNTLIVGAGLALGTETPRIGDFRIGVGMKAIEAKFR